MAINIQSAIFLIAVILFAATTPQAHGAGLTVQGLSVTGGVCCTPTGNCPGGRGLAGLPVSLNCTILGANVRVAQTMTNADGTFNITIRTLPGLVSNLLRIPCNVSVQIPLESIVCPALQTVNGVITSTLQSTGTLLTALFGWVQTFTLTGFGTITVGV